MVRVAIAGAAHPHVEYATREVALSPSLTLVAVSDPSVDVARECAAPFEAAVFTDHRAMLDRSKPDVVVTAGIYGQRGDTIVDALNAGCDVIADKPLCTTLPMLAAIRAASEANRRSVTLLLEKRYCPETIAALDLVRSGQLGTLVEISSTGPHKLRRDSRPSWFFKGDNYGGILADLLTHDLDLALLFTQATRGTISGVMAGTLSDRPDFRLSCAATIRTASHLMVLEANWLTPAASPVHGDYHMKLVGTEGVADLWWARQRLSITTNERAAYDVELGSGFRPAELAFDALASGETPPLAGDESFTATQLALLAQESADGEGLPRPWHR